jgi:tetratricopeptide (TPR) repeat protein
MFEFLIIILFLFVLALIFYRRYKLLGEGVAMPLHPEAEQEPPRESEVETPVVEQEAPTEKAPEEPPVQAPPRKDPEIICKLGVSYLRDGLHGKAEEVFRGLLIDHPQNPAYLSNLGLSLYGQKKLEEALDFYEKAIAMDDTRPGRYISLAQVLRELDRLEDAIEHVRKALVIEERNLEYLLLLADMCRAAEKHDEVRATVQLIMEIDPQDSRLQDFR